MGKLKTLRELQLAALKRIRQRPLYPGYLIVFTAILALMRVANELTSNISTYIQSSVVNEFFVGQGLSYEEGLARFTAISFVCSAFTLLALFYKPLADRIGRKTILCVNAVGVVLGVLFIHRSPTVYVYCVGIALCSFFTQNDVQMIYIMETAPRDRGARLFGIIKSFGILGLILIPVLRDTVMGNDGGKWRDIFFVPLLVCGAIVFLLFFFCRESRIFVEDRIALLERGGEEPAARRERRRPAGDQVGPVAAIRYVWRNRALRTVVAANTFYGLCSLAAAMYVESIMTTNGMSAANVTKALYVYPFVYAGLSFLGGFFADRFGRKPVIVTAGSLVAVGFVLFILACKNGWNPYLVGLLNGIYLGCYWVCGDYINVMFLEMVPTEMRTSVLMGANVLMMLGCLAGISLEVLVMLRLGLNLASVLIIVPTISACVLTVLFGVRETRGTDLNSV